MVTRVDTLSLFPARVAIVDPNTGIMTQEFYRALTRLFTPSEYTILQNIINEADPGTGSLDLERFETTPAIEASMADQIAQSYAMVSYLSNTLAEIEKDIAGLLELPRTEPYSDVDPTAYCAPVMP